MNVAIPTWSNDVPWQKRCFWWEMGHSDQSRMGEGTVILLQMSQGHQTRLHIWFDDTCTPTSSLCVQGHYRFAEALFYMGEFERAFNANSAAIDMCSDDDQVVLHEQKMKFIKEVTKPNSTSLPPNWNTRSCLWLVQPMEGGWAGTIASNTWANSTQPKLCFSASGSVAKLGNVKQWVLCVSSSCTLTDAVKPFHVFLHVVTNLTAAGLRLQKPLVSPAQTKTVLQRIRYGTGKCLKTQLIEWFWWDSHSTVFSCLLTGATQCNG